MRDQLRIAKRTVVRAPGCTNGGVEIIRRTCTHRTGTRARQRKETDKDLVQVSRVTPIRL
jgi:hypothetical protein